MNFWGYFRTPYIWGFEPWIWIFCIFTEVFHGHGSWLSSTLSNSWIGIMKTLGISTRLYRELLAIGITRKSGKFKFMVQTLKILVLKKMTCNFTTFISLISLIRLVQVALYDKMFVSGWLSRVRVYFLLVIQLLSTINFILCWDCTIESQYRLSTSKLFK